MILDRNGRILPQFAPQPRYRPGMHEKWQPFMISLPRIARLRVWRGRNRMAFYPGLFDREYRNYAQLDSNGRVFCFTTLPSLQDKDR